MYSAAMGTEMATSTAMFAKNNLPKQDFKTRVTNCALLTVTVICICVLVVCGVMIVREYALARAYEVTTCHVQNITYAKNNIHCTFCDSSKDKAKDKGAKACSTSQFPCIQVMVAYDYKGTRKQGLLHMDSLQAKGIYSQCSFSVCKKRKEDNERIVEDFKRPWDVKKKKKVSFQCYYDTVGMKDVITQKMHTKSDVVHSMLWPSIVIIVCGAIFLRLEMRRRGLTFCGTGTKDGKAPVPASSKYGANSSEGRNGKDAHQTLLKVSPNSSHQYPKCKLLKNAQTPVISSSLSDLDRIKPAADKRTITVSDDNGRLASSVSADRLQNQSSGADSSGGDTENLSPANLSKIRQDSVKSESPTGSHGSRVMGLETPV